MEPGLTQECPQSDDSAPDFDIDEALDIIEDLRCADQDAASVVADLSDWQVSDVVRILDALAFHGPGFCPRWLHNSLAALHAEMESRQA